MLTLSLDAAYFRCFDYAAIRCYGHAYYFRAFLSYTR